MLCCDDNFYEVLLWSSLVMGVSTNGEGRRRPDVVLCGSGAGVWFCVFGWAGLVVLALGHTTTKQLIVVRRCRHQTTIILLRQPLWTHHLLCSFEFSMRCQTWPMPAIPIKPSPPSNHFLMHLIAQLPQLGFLLLSNPSNLILEIIVTLGCTITDHCRFRKREDSLLKLLALSMKQRKHQTST